MKIKILIIDDDPFIIDLLKDKLDQFFPEVEIIGIANSGADGKNMIAKLKPELVFLDVEMDDMTGFDMLSQLESINFKTIFITSYSHYAIKAIRFNALDYLVKPIDLGELRQAIRRYKFQKKENLHTQQINQALSNLKIKNVAEQILTLKTQEGEMRLALKDIVKVKGERNYSYIYLTNNSKRLSTKSLGELEQILSDKGFFRCHRSYLVNFHHIQSITNSPSLLLTDDSDILIARRKKSDFMKWFDEQNIL